MFCQLSLLAVVSANCLSVKDLQVWQSHGLPRHPDYDGHFRLGGSLSLQWFNSAGMQQPITRWRMFARFCACFRSLLPMLEHPQTLEQHEFGEPLLLELGLALGNGRECRNRDFMFGRDLAV